MGVPLLLVIVVAIIMLYVCWSCYHRKQMRYLTRVYVTQTAVSAELSAVDNEAPPSYTPDDDNKPNSGRGLPIYTEDDPFPDSSHPPPLYLNEDCRTSEQHQEPTEGERASEDNSTTEETTADDQPLIT